MSTVNNESNGGMINPNIVYGGVVNSRNLFYYSIVSTVVNGTFYGNLLQANYLTSPLEAGITSIDLGNVQVLTNLAGTYVGLTSFTANNLILITSSFALTTANLTTLSMPALLAANTFTLSGASLTSVNLGALVNVNSNFSGTVAALTTLSLPNLINVNAFSVTGASITTLTLTSLATVVANFGPSLASLTTLSLPALVKVGTTFTITAANMTTFSMGSTLKSIGGNFTMSGMKLDQASVNGILVSLAALDGTGGTTAYSNLTINISGGTSASPNGAGSTAKTTLQGRGCTVTTN